jgi:hypothetical protein
LQHHASVNDASWQLEIEGGLRQWRGVAIDRADLKLLFQIHGSSVYGQGI